MDTGEPVRYLTMTITNSRFKDENAVDWIKAGQNVEGDYASTEGVSNRPTRELLDNVEYLKYHFFETFDRLRVASSAQTVTASANPNSPDDPDNPDAGTKCGDFFLLKYNGSAVTTINLPYQPATPCRIRVKRDVDTTVPIPRVRFNRSGSMINLAWPAGATDVTFEWSSSDDTYSVINNDLYALIQDLSSKLASTSVAGLIRIADTANAADRANDGLATSPPGVIDLVSGRQAIWLPAVAWTARLVNGADVSVLNVNDVTKPEARAYAFDADAIQYIEYQTVLPKKWKRDVDLKSRIYWTVNAANTGVARWGIRAAWIGNNEQIQGTGGSPFGSLVTVDDAHNGSASEVNQTADSPGFSGSGNASEGDMIFLQLQRVATASQDTQSELALFLGMLLFIETNAPTDD